MAKNYGVPYKGSKSKYAEKILACLPDADVFADLFAGGCAMTHAAMVSGKYKRFIANDIDDMGIRLFADAIAGKYRGENRWVSREMFELLKDSDPYVRLCWSFGNNGRDYLYSRKLEPYKKAVHEMIFAETPHERRLKWRTVYRLLQDVSTDKEKRYELQSLQSLQRLQSLERLERPERLETHSLDYQDVAIPDGAVIYCDIPYRGTNKYNLKEEFDYPRFYKWARQQKNIFISSYEMPEEFRCIKEIEAVTSMAGGNIKRTERIYIPDV